MKKTIDTKKEATRLGRRITAPVAQETDAGGVVGMTKKEFAREVNINTIMRKALSQGGVPIPPPARFGDFSNVRTYLDAHQALLEADELFMSLPAPFRKELNNSPAEFVKFATDPKNLERMRELGLAPEPKAKRKPAGASSQPAGMAPGAASEGNKGAAAEKPGNKDNA